MDITTNYLGLHLRNPVIPSSSPLMEDVENIRRMEDAGAAAVVLHSLFEEQVTNEALMLHYHTTQGTESFAESLTYFPEPSAYKFGGEEYVEHIHRVKQAVSIPVIASLNGVTSGGWLKYARQFEEAGADAVELNLYYIAADPAVNAVTLEAAYCEVVRDLRRHITIPIAVKLSPFYTSLPHFASKLGKAGADGLVLFNRFYQPDFDLDTLKIHSDIRLSNPGDIRLALRWIAILYGRLNCSLAATGGVHSAADAIKLIMAGADAVYFCSAILRNGILSIKTLVGDIQRWLSEHEYASLAQAKGSMSQKSVAEPAAFERALYLKELKSYRW